MNGSMRVVGIDLGTTNSVVAAYKKAEEPRILQSREGRDWTRSCVSLQKRKNGQPPEVLVGDTAYDNFPVAPEDTIISVKRLMGRSVNDPEVEKVRQWAPYRIVAPSDGTQESIRVVMGGKEYSPVEISCLILKKLKADAEYRLGEEVTHAVVTVPAYFSQIQCAATREAAEKAGLRVIRILDEPTAAAIAYGVDTQEAGEQNAKTILVYDLGGGTFDVSILVYGGVTFAQVGIGGDMWLGGDNFDQKIVEKVVEYVKKEYGIDSTANKRFMAELKMKAQVMKERLSSKDEDTLILPGLLKDSEGDLVDVIYELTRKEYEELVGPLVARSMEIVERTLAEAHLTPADIDVVLMAGNASSMPLVQRTVEGMFGAGKVKHNLHPKYCVAMGAAIFANNNTQVIYCGNPDPADPARMCLEPNPVDATICRRCGGSLEASRREADLHRDEVTLPRIYCTNPDPIDPRKRCHYANPPDATICARCGGPLETSKRPEQNDTDIIIRLA